MKHPATIPGLILVVLALVIGMMSSQTVASIQAFAAAGFVVLMLTGAIALYQPFPW